MARRRRRGSIVSKETDSGKRYRSRLRIKYRDHYGPWRDTKREAEQDLSAMQDAEDRAPVHVATMLQAWQAHVKRLGARNTKETTLHGYKLKWQALSKFFEPTANIAELDAGDVEAYVRWRKPQVKTRTVLHEMALLRAVWGSAWRTEGSVTEYVRRLRILLAPSGIGECIVTRKGFGYSFDPDAVR